MSDLNRLLARHGIWAALWDYYRSDGGFAFLGSAGARKPVFDPVYGTPSVTRLPGPAALSPTWEARRVDATFECRPHASATVLLPQAGCGCQAATRPCWATCLPPPRGPRSWRPPAAPPAR